MSLWKCKSENFLKQLWNKYAHWWIKSLQPNVNLYFMQSFLLTSMQEIEVLIRPYMKYGLTKHHFRLLQIFSILIYGDELVLHDHFYLFFFFVMQPCWFLNFAVFCLYTLTQWLFFPCFCGDYQLQNKRFVYLIVSFLECKAAALSPLLSESCCWAGSSEFCIFLNSVFKVQEINDHWKPLALYSMQA